MTGLTILVVEDNPPSLRLLQDLLGARGHHVLSAVDVTEARALLLGPRLPEVVLLDVQVPGGGGALLLREIRENPALSTVVVIAVTALAMSGDRERFLDLGFAGYISKPIDARSFAQDVEKLLRDHQSGG